eukprot:g13982.t1
MLLVLVISFISQEVHGKLHVEGEICYNPNCFRGYNCKCNCIDGKGVVFLWGGCNQCNPSICSSALPQQCGAGVNDAQCDVSCWGGNLNADGQCHEVTSSRLEPLFYTAECSKDNKHFTASVSKDNKHFTASVSRVCNTSSEKFTGVSNACYYFQNISVSFRVNCKAGISDGGIVGIVLGSVALCFLCFWCAYQDSIRIEVPRRSFKSSSRTTSPKAPVQKEGVQQADPEAAAAAQPTPDEFATPA